MNGSFRLNIGVICVVLRRLFINNGSLWSLSFGSNSCLLGLLHKIQVVFGAGIVFDRARTTVPMPKLATCTALRFVSQRPFPAAYCNMLRTSAIGAMPDAVDHVGMLTISVLLLLGFSLELFGSLRREDNSRTSAVRSGTRAWQRQVVLKRWR